MMPDGTKQQLATTGIVLLYGARIFTKLIAVYTAIHKC